MLDDGITDQKQLFAAGTLISRSDYEDVVTERTIAKLCGYPLCRASLRSDVSRRGSIVRTYIREQIVYDLNKTTKFCSAPCLVNSLALQEARTYEFDTGKVNRILWLFGDALDVKEEGLGLSKRMML